MYIFFHTLYFCSSDPIVVADILKEENTELDSILSQPPCFVVIGQTCYAKACVVNELFGQTIIPPVDDQQFGKKWRMVRFRYGEQKAMGLSLPNSYELVDNLAAYSRPWKTIPSEDLEVYESDTAENGDDAAKKSAVLEVSLKHALLQNHTKVVMAPCNHANGVKEVMEECLEGVLPIVIYAIGFRKLQDKVGLYVSIS